MIDASSASIIAATAAALFLKGLVLSYVQVAARYRARSFSRPEDARLLGLAPKSEPDLAVRAAGALRNEGENAPYFLALAVIYALIGGPPVPLLGISSLYVMARLFQGYAQVRALQPQRMIGYLTGAVATLCLAVLIVLDGRLNPAGFRAGTSSLASDAGLYRRHHAIEIIHLGGRLPAPLPD